MNRYFGFIGVGNSKFLLRKLINWLQLKKQPRLKSVFFQKITFNYRAWYNQFSHDVSGSTYVITLLFKNGKKYQKQLENVDLIFTSKAIELLNEKITPKI